MCGIVGYVGTRPAESVLVEGLKYLEYRGYDSAGIATLHKKNKCNDAWITDLRRVVGKISHLRSKLNIEPCLGSIGIGHTRWATHGGSEEKNAHPHFVDGISVVHNGIVENYREIKKKLSRYGCVFSSDTDSEVFAHIIAIERRKNSLVDAVICALSQIKGAFAIAVIDEMSPDTIICAKRFSPLVIGVAKNETFIASDFAAMLGYVRDFIVLEDNDIAIVSGSGVAVMDMLKTAKNRSMERINWDPVFVEKAGYKHFLHKEIHEQPLVISDLLKKSFDFSNGSFSLSNLNLDKIKKAKRICIVACGSSYYAGMIGKHYIEMLSKIPVSVELASEYRYRYTCIETDALFVGISQSGETADTIAALEVIKKNNATIMAICNAPGSSLVRLCADSVGTFYTDVGPEISVASTKAFTAQIISLNLLGLFLAKENFRISDKKVVGLVKNMGKIPAALNKVLSLEKKIRGIAKKYIQATHMLFLGRGIFYPIAMEGALKMKELSYIHAEGYAAGEMKHGPIALVDSNMPVVALAFKGDPTYPKMISNIEEIRSRGGSVIAVCGEDDEFLAKTCDSAISIKDSCAFLAPLASVISLQLFSYHMADLRNLDIDRPRNLAKSVTVE